MPWYVFDLPFDSVADDVVLLNKPTPFVWKPTAIHSVFGPRISFVLDGNLCNPSLVQIQRLKQTKQTSPNRYFCLVIDCIFKLCQILAVEGLLEQLGAFFAKENKMT